MAEAVYPTSIAILPDVVDEVDDIEAEHMNRVRKEIIALQSYIGTDPHGSTANLTTRLAVNTGTDGAIQKGTGFPAGPVEGQMFYRSDEDTMYIFDGSSWDAVGSSLSNVLYDFHGTNVINTPNLTSTSGAEHSVIHCNSTSWVNLQTTVYHKLQGQLTLTGHFRYTKNSTSTTSINFSFGANGLTTPLSVGTTPVGTVLSTSFVHDVSALAEGTTYALTINGFRGGGGGSFGWYITDLVIRAE